MTSPRSRSLLPVLARVAMSMTLVACGLSKRALPADVDAGLPGASGGIGGMSVAGGAASAGVPTTSEPAARTPAVARHEYLGSSAAAACFTGAVATSDGFFTVGSYVGQSGIFVAAGDRQGSPWDSAELTRSVGAGIVFSLPGGGYALAWSPGADGFPVVQLFDEHDVPRAAPTPSVQGSPLAGVGLADGFAILFGPADGSLVLYRSRGDGIAQISLETGSCAADGAFAVGAIGADVLVAYSCHESGGDSSATRHLVVARVSGDDDHVGSIQASADVTGVPAAYYLGIQGFVFAGSVDGSPALVYVDPESGTTRVVPISGLAAEGNRSDSTYSVVATGSDALVSLSGCQRREDASPTGSVALCHVDPATGEAECSEANAPCGGATLTATSAGVVLLPCGWDGPSIVEIADPSAPPAPGDGWFPLGYASLAPLALDCTGSSCTALVAIDSVAVTTSEDERLASLAVELGESCEGTICGPVALPAPIEPHSHSASGALSGGFLLETQPTGFPFGVVWGAPPESDYSDPAPELSLVDRTEVLWTQPLAQWPDELYRAGDTLLLLNQSYPPEGLSVSSATAQGVVQAPYLSLRLQNQPPATARCGDRLLMHAMKDGDGTATSQLHPAIFALDLVTHEFNELFNPGIWPNGSVPPAPIACAGDEIFLADTSIHEFSSDGTRRSDIALTPVAAPLDSYDPAIWQLETRNDHALLLRSTSGASAVDALFLYGDRSARAYTLPLPPDVVPLTSFRTAPDRGDGWLRAIYQGKGGALYASAWQVAD